MKTKKDNTKLIIGLIVLVLIGWFYWFHWRPNNLKRECYGLVEKYLKENGGETYFGRKNKLFKNCLNQKGYFGDVD